MTAFRRRDRHTVWYNPTTITDVDEALALLRSGNSSSKPTHLRYAKLDGKFVWEIAVPTVQSDCSGFGETWEHYDVSAGLVELLMQESLVESYLEQGCCVSRDPARLVLTEKAKEVIDGHDSHTSTEK